MKGVPEVTEDPFHSLLVRNPWRVHVLTDTIHSIGQIRSGEGQILKTAHNTLIESRILKRRPITSRKGAKRSHGGVDRLAERHVSLCEKVFNIFCLSDKNTR